VGPAYTGFVGVTVVDPNVPFQIEIMRIPVGPSDWSSESSGTISPDQDFSAFVKARQEYTALKRR
jgi:hypothetical protein